MSNEPLSLAINTESKRTLDPLVSLLYHESSFRSGNQALSDSHAASVSSVCFIQRRQDSTAVRDTCSDAESETTDENFNAPLQLQCQQLLQSKDHKSAFPTSSTQEMSSTLELEGRLLGACYSNGECLLWDLGKRTVIETISTCDSRGPGLTLRRLDDCDTRFFYQTRDEAGTISLHDLNAAAPSSLGDKNVLSVQTLQEVETYSQSFCEAVPCRGNPNLLATPSQHHSFVMVRDWRMPSSHHPVAYFHAVSGCREEDEVRKCGMLTSLAMAETENASSTVIACGLESGLVVVHDLAMIQKGASQSYTACTEPCRISLTTEPILSLDMLASQPRSLAAKHAFESSFVAIAGMAGNEEELLEIPQCERGRVALIKICQGLDRRFHARLRTRISTLVDASSSQAPSGKPGAGICRFRSDGRIFAVGGWDKRVRIFDRSAKIQSKHSPLALLRGHFDSVNAIDWSFDAVSSGLIATGSSDGRVYVWNCFPSKARPA
jgi:WD domain, G-beta repeat